ncbi:MAG: PepSY domain-containing protein, partial [bacterium]
MHEGQLFGLANQCLGVIATGGLMLLAMSGSWMWWRRRPAHTLGAPTISVPPSRSWLLAGGLLGLGILMPAFGLSVIIVAISEQALRSLAPSLAEWLGLRSTL